MQFALAFGEGFIPEGREFLGKQLPKTRRPKKLLTNEGTGV